MVTQIRKLQFLKKKCKTWKFIKFSRKSIPFLLILTYFCLKCDYKRELPIKHELSTNILERKKMTIVTPMGFHSFLRKKIKMLKITYFTLKMLFIVKVWRKSDGNNEIPRIRGFGGIWGLLLKLTYHHWIFLYVL